MRLLCLIQGQQLPSSRVRVLNLVPELEAKHIQVTVEKFPRRPLDKIRLYFRIPEFDVVLLQKRLISWVDLLLLRSISKRLVFDFDDAIYYRHDSHDTLVSKSRMNKFRRIANAADLVIAGNDILAKTARQFSNHVIVLPSAVETQDIPCRQHDKNHDIIRIGWIGGVKNLNHLQSLSGVLRRLAEKHPIELRIISGTSLDVPGVDVRFVQWSLATQEQELAALDIGIMPLPDNPHTEGKCAYKALQYMAAGVPPVVSDVGTNKTVVIHGQSGFVANTEEEFFASLERLIEHSELRAKIGDKAKARVITHYSIQSVGRQLAEKLTSL